LKHRGERRSYDRLRYVKMKNVPKMHYVR